MTATAQLSFRSFLLLFLAIGSAFLFGSRMEAEAAERGNLEIRMLGYVAELNDCQFQLRNMEQESSGALRASYEERMVRAVQGIHALVEGGASASLAAAHGLYDELYATRDYFATTADGPAMGVIVGQVLQSLSVT